MDLIPRKPLIFAVIGMVLLEMGYWYSCYQSHNEPLPAPMASVPVMDLSVEEEEMAEPDMLVQAETGDEPQSTNQPHPATDPAVLQEPPVKAVSPETKPAKKVAPPSPRPAKAVYAKKSKPATAPRVDMVQARPSTIEAYVNQAWGHVISAQKPVGNSEASWKKALEAVERLFKDHPEWVKAAQEQNDNLAQLDEKFPLKDMESLSAAQVEPIFKKYGTLYHVGTAEFIRIMAYNNLQRIAQEKNDKRLWAELHWKKIEAAERLINKYYFAQAFDQQGWMWQPALSLNEYIDVDDIPTSTYALANANN